MRRNVIVVSVSISLYLGSYNFRLDYWQIRNIRSRPRPVRKRCLYKG